MVTDPWPAPTANGPVDARVTVPGSKSVANRALLLAALSDGTSSVAGLPAGSRDLDLMLTALRALGAEVAGSPETSVTVTPGTATSAVSVECGLAGTVMRFVPPVAALTSADVHFDGDPRARERPMAALLAALRSLGIRIAADATRLPFTVHGIGHVPGGVVDVDASTTSQVVSALLLSGARFDRGVTVRHRGAPIPSLPHIAMTMRMLNQHGVATDAHASDRTNADWSVTAGPIRALDRTVEPDLSNAAPFAALALITHGRIEVPDWPSDSLQPDRQLREVFIDMGARFDSGPDGMSITGTGAISGVDADLRDLGELVPTIAAVAALADSPSRLSGIGHIAGHETDRLRAIAGQLNALGGDVHADSDGLTIRPARLHGGLWSTYSDHRMATCGAILGARVPGVLIEDVATTAKTFPGFSTAWAHAVTGAGN